MGCRARASRLFALHLRLSVAQVWRYVNFFQGTTYSADEDDGTSNFSAATNASREFTSMSVLLTNPSTGNTLIEWGNMLDKGRAFAEWGQEPDLQRHLQVYAVEDAQVIVNDIVSGAVLAMESVLAGNIVTMQYTANQGSDITADGDILAHMRYENEPHKLNYPLLRPAPVIFGMCTQSCAVATPGAVAATVHRVCSDGTIEDIAANANVAGSLAYGAPVCRYEAPVGGPLLVGHSWKDGSGGEAVALVSSDQFQMYFTVPLANNLVLVYSDQPADCSYWSMPGSTTEFQLQGFSESPGGPGAYFSKTSSVDAGTVFCCSVPVAAVVEFACGSGDCSWKETNILAMSDPPFDCTATTTVSSVTTTTTSTTTTTTSATLTTSTTTTAEVPPLAADALVQLAEKWEERELARLLASGEDSVSFSDFGITTLVVRLQRVDAGIPPFLLGTAGVEVALPDALFSQLQVTDVILTATSFGPEYNDRLEWPGEGPDVLREGAPGIGDERLVSVTVYAVANVNIVAHTIANLSDPINITLPINRTAELELECAYWDHASGFWRNDGVAVLEGPVGEAMVCQSTHLSLFAAIARGYIQAWSCSQVSLFNRESILELGKAEWTASPGAQAMWGTLAFLFLLLLAAAVQDCREASRWSDEDFLVVMVEAAEADNMAEKEDAAAAASRWTCCCAACCGVFCAWCKESVALRDVIDEVASQYFAHWSEARDFCEALAVGLSCTCEGGGGLVMVVHRMMTNLVVSGAQRQAAAAEGISLDLASFALEDEDLHEVLVQGHVGSRQAATGPSDASPELSESSPTNSGKPDSRGSSVQRRALWLALLDSLSAKTDRFTLATSQCSTLPCAALRLIWWEHPIGACLVRCIFLSSKIRVLLFMVDILGAVLLSTVFFSSTSTVPSKRNRSAACKITELGDMIGRLLAIATASVILSSIPAMVLGSLCTRGIRRVDSVDSKEWRRQLQVWRIQDAIICTVSILYVLFSAFFVSLFAANTSAEDHVGWITGIAISLAEDLVVIPVVVGSARALLAPFLLSILSCCGRTKQELVGEAAVEVANKPNVTLEVMKV